MDYISTNSLSSPKNSRVEYYISTRLNRQRIEGLDRKPVTFNSSIDALNFMVRHGWGFVYSQVTGTESGAEGKLIYMLRWPKKPN